MTKEVQSLLLVSKSPVDTLYLIRRNLPGISISDLVNRICTLRDMPRYDEIYEYHILKDSITTDFKTILELCVREKYGDGITAYRKFDSLLMIPEGTTLKYLQEDVIIDENILNTYFEYLKAHGELKEEWERQAYETKSFIEKSTNPSELIKEIESILNNDKVIVDEPKGKKTVVQVRTSEKLTRNKRKKRRRLSKRAILARYYAKKILIILLVIVILCGIFLVLKKMPYIELTILSS